MARRVYIRSTYLHVTKGCRGKGLLYRELVDADTGETAKRYGRAGHGWLVRHAEKVGWTLVRGPSAATSS